MIMKIGIVCEGWSFMEDLLKELRSYHTVSILDPPFTSKRLESFMKSVNLLFVEWCGKYLPAITSLPKYCKIINRLHGMAVMGRGVPWLKEIDWSKIDLMIFVNEHPRNIFKKMVSFPVKSIIIYNGVNLNKFTYDPNRSYGKRIGFVGHFKKRKDPLPVIDMMLYLQDCTLKVRSDPSVEPALTAKCMSLINFLSNVQYVPHLDDMNSFYQDLDILVNNSTYESQGVAILEAMATGVYPLIRDWPQVEGVAEKLYPPQNVYKNMWECTEKITEWMYSSTEKKRALSQAMRKIVKDKYDAKIQVQKLRKTLESVAD